MKNIEKHFNETPDNFKWADYTGFVRSSSNQTVDDAMSATEDVLKALDHLQKAIEWQKLRIERLQQEAGDFFILAMSTGEEVVVKTPPGKLVFYGSADSKEKLIALLEETLQKLKSD